MAKQTAVQWLVMTYNQRQGYIRFEDIDKAKEMEKEQIKFAYNDGAEHIVTDKYMAMEQYYNDTYENNK